MPPKGSPARRRMHLRSYLGALAWICLFVFLTHQPYWKLPFFWDEMGYFVPAALDLYRDGAWTPRSTTPNVHPPAVAAYLAGIWQLTGYSIPSTRLAMLLLASLAALAVFLLSIELCRPVPGVPAFWVLVLLLLSPLFYTQAMMAQLDLPAMLFTALALLFFLQERMVAAAIASTLLVLVRETGVLAPLVFGLWLQRERRTREAALFLAPLAALGSWLLAVTFSTGHPFGSGEFTRYNLFYPLHPVRFAVALAKRLYFLFFENFRWAGTIVIVTAWRRSRLYANRAWRVAGVLGAGHVLLVSLLGGATLERYLLPVLPLVYIAMASGWTACPRWCRLGSQALVMTGLTLGLFWNPPYSFPYENNLAMVDFVDLQRTAAQFLEQTYPGRTVLTAWPFTDALRRPEFGYVRQPAPVRELADFRPSTAAGIDAASIEVFVLYSRSWDPAGNPLHLSFVKAVWRRYFGYEPALTSADCQRRWRLTPVARWQRRGQWIEILAPSGIGKQVSNVIAY
jgi:hypothetical protein